jgi:tetratricopeptide (TPR) repeat protein
MRLFVALLLMGQTAAAWADNAADAKAHYQSATAFFAVGEFAKAADEYQQAYTLKPDPALLYNAAQSYRLAGNNERAIILYKNYVSLYPDQANVDEVRNQIAKLKDAIAAQENAKNNPPTNTVPPTSSAAVPSSSPPAPVVAAAAEKPRPVTRKAWFWATLGASALVIAGVTVGVVLAVQPHAPTPSLGQVSGN